MTSETVQHEVRQFIKKNFLFDDNANLGDELSLIGTGVVDSTGVLELIAFLEKRFDVAFDDSELVVDNFDTVERITSFIVRKLNNTSPRPGKTQ